MISVSLVWSHANLLSGDLDDCQNPDDETCSAGIATINAFLRHNSDADLASLVITRIDYQSVFVQMHPLDWGVNRLILHDHFGWNVYFAYSTLMSQNKADSLVSQRDLSVLQTSDIRPLLGNTVVATSNSWSEYAKHIHFDEATGLAVFFISVGEETELATNVAGAVKSVSQVEAAKGLLNYVAQENQERGCAEDPSVYDLYFLQRNRTRRDDILQNNTTARCWIPVIAYEEVSEDLFRQFLEGILSLEKNPPALIYLSRNSIAEFKKPQQVGPHGIWVVSASTSYLTMNQLRLHLNEDNRTVTNVTFIEQDLEVIPSEIKDDIFREDIKFLRGLADEAKSNNPVTGLSRFMPLTNDPLNIEVRPCMGGECPLGNLYTDALRWRTGADFAFINSGGIRGPGWPEGPVRVSNIWESLPFANTECTGVISGINLFRVFEFSTSKATFLSTWTADGDKLLQVSGLRYTYNTGIEAPRLVALQIWDDSKNDYVPVERLKFYKFATGSWECSGFDPLPSLLGDELTIEGEEPAEIGDVLLQTIVGEYLEELEMPYDTRIQGRLVNDTSKTEPLQFIQTQDSCNSTTYWVKKFLSCLDCPSTEKVEIEADQYDFEGESKSTSEQETKGRIFNGEMFPITVVAKSKPNWVTFLSEEVWIGDEGQKVLIPSGKFFSFDFAISTEKLEAGVATAPISFGVLDGGNFPGCVGRDAVFDLSIKVSNEPQFEQTGSVLIVGFTLMAVVVATALFWAFWVYRNQEKRVVKSMQPIFLIVLCFGVVIISLSIVPLSIHGREISDWGHDAACMAVPWLLSMGFTIVMSALISKLWRINKLFNGGRFRRVKVTSKAAIVPFCALLAVNLVLMLVWTLVDPMQYEVHEVKDEDWKLYGTCTNMGAAGWSFLGLTIGLNFFALLLVCYEAYKARDISEDYSESKSLGFAVFSWIQILLVGIPVLFLIDDDNVNPKYFLQVALIFAGCMSMILIIHIPLFNKIRSRSVGTTRGSSTLISGLAFKLSNNSIGEVLSAFMSRPMAVPPVGPSSANADKGSTPEGSTPEGSSNKEAENNRSNSYSITKGSHTDSTRSEGWKGNKDLGEFIDVQTLANHEAIPAQRVVMVAESEATVNA